MSQFAVRRRCSVFLALMLAAALPATAHAAAPSRQETFSFGKWSMARHTLAADGAPPVSYYLSVPAARAPLVLFVQGSGCTPPFSGLGTDKRSSSILPWVGLAMSGRYAVMAVDKPYQPAALAPASPNGALDCGAAFNQHFSYDTWLATLRRALQHALARPEVDPRRVLVVGHSEGATMAAGLARAMPQVGAVALLGASGTTQLYDIVANVYRGAGSDAGKLRELQGIDAIVKEILADPDSVDKFAWGHSYRRWSSFMARAPGEDLLQSTARVYLASGMQDASVPILSTEVMFAQLRVRGRDVTMVRIPAAGHDLATGSGEYGQLQAAYDAVIRWFEEK